MGNFWKPKPGEEIRILPPKKDGFYDGMYLTGSLWNDAGISISEFEFKIKKLQTDLDKMREIF